MMAKRLDITGLIFDRLTALSFCYMTKNGQSIWECLCKCGNKTKVQLGHLKSGGVTSCGCKLKDSAQKKHGHSSRGNETSTYRTWSGMLSRCKNSKHIHWSNYGGRGICVCERWHEFSNFLADMGERQSGMSLERIDNDGNYEPSNCRWATLSEQARNKRNNRLLTFENKTLPLVVWAELKGLKQETLDSRLGKSKWDIGKALNTPVKSKIYAIGDGTPSCQNEIVIINDKVQ